MPQIFHPSLRRLLPLTAIAALTIWHSISLNIANLAISGPPEEGSAQEALRWNPQHPKALFRSALEVAADDPQAAHAQLLESLRHDPSNPLPFVALAKWHEREGEPSKAEKLMDAASALAPRDRDVQLEAARFSLRQGSYNRSVPHIDSALAHGTDFQPILFPDLLTLAESTSTRDQVFPAMAKGRLSWWPAFIEYVANNGSLEALRSLIQIREAAGMKTSEAELGLLLSRLQRDNQWYEAYALWLNHLNAEQSHSLGNLFNGGFELPISNIGFDWIVTPAQQVIVTQATIGGITGRRALQVTFKGPRIQFRHVHQFLMLAPGTYAFQGKVRPEGLEVTEGVRWSIYCDGNSTPIASSPLVSGTHRWRNFSVQLKVPAQTCEVQMIRLELEGKTAADFDARGSIWFDDLTLQRIAQAPLTLK